MKLAHVSHKSTDPVKSAEERAKDNVIEALKKVSSNEAEFKAAIDFAMQADEIKKQIDKRVAHSLKTIHARYCMLNGWPIAEIDLSVVKDKFPDRPHYAEYWYMLGTEHQYMLMTKEVVIIDGNVKLNIIFNGELIREGE